MIIIPTSDVERGHIYRMLQIYIQHRGRPNTPDFIVEAFDRLDAAIRSHSTPFDADLVASDDDTAQPGLMTHQQVADELGYAKRSISRFVQQGRLIAVGRRVSRESVEAFRTGADTP
jgi:hypothetical protein